MKTVLFIVASMFVALSANAAIDMQTAEKSADLPRSATATEATEKPVRKTRLADRSETHRAPRHVVLDENCLRFTGSRLLPDESGKGKRCVVATGRVYHRKAEDASMVEILR